MFVDLGTRKRGNDLRSDSREASSTSGCSRSRSKTTIPLIPAPDSWVTSLTRAPVSPVKARSGNGTRAISPPRRLWNAGVRARNRAVFVTRRSSPAVPPRRHVPTGKMSLLSALIEIMPWSEL